MHGNQASNARSKETGSEFRRRSSPSSFILIVESKLIHSILLNSLDPLGASGREHA
jgi:hypothetical protein